MTRGEAVEPARGPAVAVVAVLGALVLLAGCGAVKRLRAGGGMRVVRADVAFAMLRDSTDLIVVDTRESAEFEAAAGHLRSARNLPLSKLESQFAALAPLRETTLLIYCRGDDGCGEEAVSRLVGAGFRNAVLLEGGFEAWLRAGYGVLSSAPPLQVDRTRDRLPASHWVELTTGRIVAGSYETASGLYVAGRVRAERFRPRGGVEGVGAFCRRWETESGARGQRGWMELSSGRFVGEGEGRLPGRPWVRGCLGSDLLFRPDSRDVTP